MERNWLDKLDRRLARCGLLAPVLLFAAFAAVCVLLAEGPACFVYLSMWQFLSPEHLRADPLGCLLYLHSQPPLLNVLLWIALSAESLFSVTLESAAAAIMFTFALLCCVFWYEFARRALERESAALLLLILIVLNPAFYLFTRMLFYPNVEMALLGAFFLSLWCWSGNPARGKLIGSALLFTAMVYLRALWHPATALPLAALIGVYHGRRAGNWRAGGASALLFCALTLGLAAPWIIKNAVLFNSPGFSSWTGFNLHVAPEHPFYDFIRSAGEYDEQRARAYYSPRQLQRILARPDLTERVKAPFTKLSYFNMNHYALPELNHSLMLANRRDLRRYFPQYLRRVWGYQAYFVLPAYYKNFSLQENLIDYELWIDNAYAWFHAQWYYGEGLRRMLCRALGFRGAPFNGFALAALFGVGAGLFRARGLKSQQGFIAAVMCACLLWVWMMGSLVDGPESQRMRWHVEPVYLTLLFGGIGWAVRAWRSRRAAVDAAGTAAGRANGPEAKLKQRPRDRRRSRFAGSAYLNFVPNHSRFP